jgi:hypothetical protein
LRINGKACHAAGARRTSQLRGERSAAFSHLYEQAQRVDAQSKQHIVVFTLAPRPPHLCVLDFSDNLIDRSIAKGYDEARGKTTDGEPSGRSFRKELGEPMFLEAEEK